MMELKFWETIRDDFPILNQMVRGFPLVYLDNAATTQKPRVVIDAEKRFYECDNSNIHRAAHDLSGRATLQFESVREKVARFLNARSEKEIIFTRGTTESINLIAHSYGALAVGAGDEILLTELEHHSNIVPWQLLSQRSGARIVSAPISDKGDLLLDKFRERLNSKTKIVSFTHLSNALGTVNPVAELVSLVRRYAPQAVVVVDGAQWVAHGPTDVQRIDCDFYCFSAHKLFGPTGVGVLYGKGPLLERMPPFLGGGDMIERVSFRETTFAKPPSRFEAGTPNIAGVIGLGAALDYISRFSWLDVEAHERSIGQKVFQGLQEIEGVKTVGKPINRISVASFRIDAVAPIDAAVILNNSGIAVRAGHHCCMPLMDRLGINGTVRGSWSLYTTSSDIDAFLSAVKGVSKKRAMKALAKVPDPISITFADTFEGSVDDAARRIREEFDECLDSAMKQELLFDWGQNHRNLLEQLRSCTTPVAGCLSEVRVFFTRSNEGTLFMASDSNAQIVRGLLNLLEKIVSGHSIVELRRFDIKNFFNQLGIEQFLSLQRRNGLDGVLQLLKQELAK